MKISINISINIMFCIIILLIFCMNALCAPYESKNLNSGSSTEASASDYPTVTQLELKIFQNSYPSENIYLRLTRLERRIFGATFPNNSLSDRVDKLVNLINPGNQNIKDDEDDSYSESYSANSVSDSISSLELRYYGRYYESELTESRLSRLERKIFGTEQSGSANERLSRLEAISGSGIATQTNYPISSLEDFSSDYSQPNNNQPYGIKSFLIDILQNIALPVVFSYLGQGNNNYIPSSQGYSPFQQYIPGYGNNSYNYSPSYYPYRNGYTPYPSYQTHTRGYNNINTGVGVRILP